MQILIPTEPNDAHAIMVKLALENMGHEATLYFTGDFPTQQTISAYMDENHYIWKIKDQESSILNNNPEIVWWRRPRKPYLPKNITHPDDYRYFFQENTLFYESFTQNLAPDAWWINPKEAAHRANFKLLQLRMAKASGLMIPTTLCSNDAIEIRHFIEKHRKQGVVYKAFAPNTWFEPKQIKSLYTAKISPEKLPKDSILELSAGIFQTEIKKKYELRIVCFGDYQVAAKLNSQAHPEGQTDWRQIPYEQMKIEPYTLDRKLAKDIQKFMRELGIVFGSFDFIVSTDNQYIFLEVNEQGQFLWLEQYNPEFKMLDIFTQFLINQSVHFNWNPQQIQHIMEDYAPEILPILKKNHVHHIDYTEKEVLS